MRFLLILVLSFVITGCTSLGKGIAEAVLEHKEKKDTRLCEIISKGFDGIAPTLKDGKGMTKLLQIHGVGHHVPGYSTEFLEKLAKELDMSVRSSNFKEIKLTSPRFPNKKLGVLRVKRLLNEAETEELLFYELTWSEITADEKAELEYDTSGEYSYRRAEVNRFLKKFSNDTSPDPLLYMGYHHDEILASFTSAFCWMISAEWDELPDISDQYCNPLTPDALQNLETDSYSFVSHSLGSRITIDGMQDIASKLSDKKELGDLLDKESLFIKTFRNKTFSIYMLSNQLPLLQMGRQLPEVTEQTAAYCNPDGDQYKNRIVNKMNVVAFSDPNDILSYAIPEGFAEKKIDSRLCIEISNVTINVSNVIDLFGFGKFSNPLTAHTAYDSDDRVVALIARGIGNPVTKPLIQQMCKWTRLID